MFCLFHLRSPVLAMVFATGVSVFGGDRPTPQLNFYFSIRRLLIVTLKSFFQVSNSPCGGVHVTAQTVLPTLTPSTN